LSVLLESVNSGDSLLAFGEALAKDRRDAVIAEKGNPNSPYGPDAGAGRTPPSRLFSKRQRVGQKTLISVLRKDFLQTILGGGLLFSCI